MNPQEFFDDRFPVVYEGINADVPGPIKCICATDCDCADSEGFVSEFCPAHNRYPRPWIYCKAHGATKFAASKTASAYANREAWLDAFVLIMRPQLTALNYFVPVAIRVSIGFPSKGGLSRTRKKLYEVWPTEASKDGSLEIFISPVVSDPMEALVTLTGGLGYAIVGNNDKEGFTKYCKALGLCGKPSTLFAGDELKSFLEKKLDELGSFPGAALDPDAVIKDVTDKKPGSRMLKVTCPGPECDYLVRTSKTCIMRGLPVCPCGLTMVGPDFDANGDVIPETKQ